MNSANKKILLKLSGEAFSSDKEPLSDESLRYIVQELKPLINLGVKTGIVIGGGNILRGSHSFTFLKRETIDYTGMISTIINGLILYESLRAEGVPVSITSGVKIGDILRDFNPMDDFEDIMIFAGGTGRPFFTTDTASVYRALQIKADAIVKATKVEGVYDKDPEKSKDAKFIKNISYEEAIEKRLGIMDLSAFSLAMQYRIPIYVINFFKKGNIERLLKGENIGSEIK